MGSSSPRWSLPPHQVSGFLSTGNSAPDSEHACNLHFNFNSKCYWLLYSSCFSTAVLAPLQSAPTWVAQRTEKDCHGLEARSLKPTCEKDQFLPVALRENLSRPLYQLVLAAGNPWLFLACDHIAPVPVFVRAFPLLCLKSPFLFSFNDIPSLDIGSTLNSGLSPIKILNLIVSVKTLFCNKATLTGTKD